MFIQQTNKLLTEAASGAAGCSSRQHHDVFKVEKPKAKLRREDPGQAQRRMSLASSCPPPAPSWSPACPKVFVYLI